jgi:hypothetical protein
MTAQFLIRAGGLVSAGGGAALTWNPADKGSRIVLSAGDTRATYSGPADFDPHNVRGTIGKSTGKWVFEITTSNGTMWCGFANASASNTVYMDATGLNTAWVANNTNLWRTDNGSTTIGTGGSVALVGSNITYAVDFTAELMWVAVDGGNWNNSGSADPATGTGGWDFSAMNAGPFFPWFSCNADAMFADIRTSGMAKSIPSGFSAWA